MTGIDRERFMASAMQSTDEHYDMTPDDHIRAAANDLGILHASRDQRDPADSADTDDLASLASAQAHALLAIAKTLAAQQQ